MVGMFRRISAAVVALALFASGAAAAAQEFYQGKTLRFVVGFPQRGGYDAYTRAIAHHMGRHIPGNPSTVVENMPGAGSLKATNYLFNEAKPDGLTIGNFSGALILHQVLGNKTAKYDGRKFGWVGVPVVDHLVCVLTRQSGVTTADQWFAAKRPIKIGATGPGTSSGDTPKILKATIGLPVEVVAGYQGTDDIRKAADAGEIAGGCWGWESIKATWRKQLDSGSARVVLQAMTKSRPELKDVPLAVDYAKSDEARQILEIFTGAYGYTARPYAVPPGTPAERLALLRKAFMETSKDPAFLAEARKAGLDLNPIEGETVARIFVSFYDVKPLLLARLEEIVVPQK